MLWVILPLRICDQQNADCSCIGVFHSCDICAKDGVHVSSCMHSFNVICKMLISSLFPWSWYCFSRYVEISSWICIMLGCLHLSRWMLFLYRSWHSLHLGDVADPSLWSLLWVGSQPCTNFNMRVCLTSVKLRKAFLWAVQLTESKTFPGQSNFVW